MNPDEKALFLNAVDDVKPLKPSATVVHLKPAPAPVMCRLKTPIRLVEITARNTPNAVVELSSNPKKRPNKRALAY